MVGSEGADSILGLYGAGGLGREVMASIIDARDHGTLRGVPVNSRLVFVESDPSEGKIVNDVPVLSEDRFFAEREPEKLFNVAIADTDARERLAEVCLARGGQPVSLISRHAAIYGHNSIGAGAIVGAFAQLTTNVTVGRFFVCDRRAYVSHDCEIGNFVTFGPGASCNGSVSIQDHAYVGSNAVIKHGNSQKKLVIGERAVIGMGAVVLNDVEPGTVVVGNPARPIGLRSQLASVP